MKRTVVILTIILVLAFSVASLAAEGKTGGKAGANQAKSTLNFNPSLINCSKILNELQKDDLSDEVGMAMLYAIGWKAANDYAKDGKPPKTMTEMSVAKQLIEIAELCEQNSGSTFFDVLLKMK